MIISTDKKYILINGQNKKNEHFVKSTRIYDELLDDGYVDEVIITGWDDEINSIKAQSKKYTIIPMPKPNGGMGYSNIWAQMTQYDKGLEYIKNKEKNQEEVFVLRTRPDVYIKKNFIHTIFDGVMTNKIENGIFNNKVWISYFDISKPFYMAGDCWGGNLSDMLSFVNYRTNLYPRPFQGITHVRIHIEPFLEDYPILVRYLKNEMDCCYSLVEPSPNKEKRWAKRKQNTLKHYETKFYRDLIRTYYEILDKYFFIKNEKDMVNFRGWSNAYNPNTLINNLTFEDNILKVNPYINTFIFGYDNNFIQKYLNGV